MSRPSPVLVDPERVIIRPIDFATPIDAKAGRRIGGTRYGAEVTLQGQVEVARERDNPQGEAAGVRSVSKVLVLRKLDCDRLEYVPRPGDLLTFVAGRAQSLYLGRINESPWGGREGFVVAVIEDRAPERTIREGL